jgi:NAD(P)-dependent dehydrogenase (short-subunit alcohol dehydrogenase family)
VASQESADQAIKTIVEKDGRLDVVIHNAGHMVFGAAEAFTPEQFLQVYDTNVLSTQRVNRAALPQLRKQKKGLVLWVGSTSTRGGTPPYLSPYFAAKAAMDALAVSYAAELNRWGIETSIIVPGAFTSGTNHFAHAGTPADKARQAEYENGPYAHLGDDIMKGFAATAPADADVADVAKAIVSVVDMPFGKRPVPSAHRSRAGWCRDRQRSSRSCPQRNVPQYRFVGPADSRCVFALILGPVENGKIIALPSSVLARSFPGYRPYIDRKLELRG